MHLGLIGYGSIATSLIDHLSQSRVTKITVLVRQTSTLPNNPFETKSGPSVQFVTDVSALLAAQPDLVVECAGHGAVNDSVPTLLAAGHDVIIASLGALADDTVSARIGAATTAGKSRTLFPSGAIGGLDLLRALSLAGDVDVTYRGTKPPAAWQGSPADDLVDLDSIDHATTFFSGTGREAALAFPKNANVVAALAIAAGGFDTVTVHLIADPAASANQHSYDVVCPLCSYSMKIEAAPTSGNARTSATTVFSILHEVSSYQISR